MLPLQSFVLLRLFRNEKIFLKSRRFIDKLRSMEQNIRQSRVNTDIVYWQERLLPIVKMLYDQGEINFTSVAAQGAPGGNSWEPIEPIDGQWLYEIMETDPDRFARISDRVATDYQRVIEAYLRAHPEEMPDVIATGSNWTFGSLFKWGGSLVEEGYLSHREIVRLADAFEAFFHENGKDAFGLFHGNIIGDHIFLGKDEKIYLFGMRIVVRPGKGIYDVLRGYDWAMLKADNERIGLDCVRGWMDRYLRSCDREAVKLIFALRAVGILGWDMLHRGDLGGGDSEVKRELLLRIIRREY